MCDANAADFISNKLLHFVVSIKSLAQTGSAFNLNCMRVVANLLRSFKEPTTFSLSAKYVLLCSALCGHASIKLRLAAWNLLAGLAQSFAGATNLVQVLSKLPGGFHACCLSTFLDALETASVRQCAGALFVQLLKHNTNSARIMPVSATSGSRVDDLNGAIFDMLKCHQFYGTMVDQLRLFWDEDNEPNELESPFITCDVVRTFCTIIAQLFDLSPDDTMAELQSHGLVMNIFRLTPVVIVATNVASVRLLVEVCKVVARCLSHCDHLLDAIALEEHAIVGALVSSLEPQIYGIFLLYMQFITYS